MEYLSLFILGIYQIVINRIPCYPDFKMAFESLNTIKFNSSLNNRPAATKNLT